MSHDVTVVVQARTGSSRLPGKVLRPLAGRPMLALMLERLAPVHARSLVVATSDLDRDDPVADLCASLDVPCVRGSESDVLGRVALAAHAFPSAHVVRLTADCPLADPALVDDVVATHVASRADYTSNTLLRTYPDGLDVEVLTTGALAAAARDAVDVAEREHVTPFVVRRPERFVLAAHVGVHDLEDERWTVDTAEDFAFVEDVLAGLSDPIGAGWTDLLARIGVRRPPRHDALVLRVDRRVVADPGRRRWSVHRGGHRDRLAVVQVDVVDGTGSLRVVDGTPAVLTDPTFPAALAQRLHADLQVHTLHTDPNTEDARARDLVLPR